METLLLDKVGQLGLILAIAAEVPGGKIRPEILSEPLLMRDLVLWLSQLALIVRHGCLIELLIRVVVMRLISMRLGFLWGNIWVLSEKLRVALVNRHPVLFWLLPINATAPRFFWTGAPERAYIQVIVIQAHVAYDISEPFASFHKALNQHMARCLWGHKAEYMVWRWLKWMRVQISAWA